MLTRSLGKLFSKKAPLKVAVTGAGGQIGYSLIPSICNG